MKIAVSIISFTPNGDKLNKKISDLCFGGKALSSCCSTRALSLTEWTKNAFEVSKAVIFIGAVGIAVRAISPYIVSKAKDPCVLVLDEQGNFVIPILSGHIGGGNSLANFVADKINAVPIITTATDLNGVFAVDSWAVSQNLVIENIENIRYVSSALLKGEAVGFVSDLTVLGKLPKNVQNGTDFDCGIVVSPFFKQPFRHTLNISPQIFLGVGSRKNADRDSLISLFNNLKICKNAVRGIASIDIKKNENSILTLCDYLNITTPTFFSSEQLAGAKGNFNKSDFVLKTTGVDNICERSAVLLAGGELFIKKTKGNGVTLAAVADWSVKFEDCNAGC